MKISYHKNLVLKKSSLLKKITDILSFKYSGLSFITLKTRFFQYDIFLIFQKPFLAVPHILILYCFDRKRLNLFLLRVISVNLLQIL